MFQGDKEEVDHNSSICYSRYQ